MFVLLQIFFFHAFCSLKTIFLKCIVCIVLSTYTMHYVILQACKQIEPPLCNPVHFISTIVHCGKSPAAHCIHYINIL